MYELFIIALVLSFILTSMLSYSFNVQSHGEQITLYMFVLFFIGLLIYLHNRYSKIDIDSYINSFVINGFVFMILFAILCVCALIYIFGFGHANTYLIIGGLILILFILLNIYKIIDVMGSPLKKRNNRN